MASANSPPPATGGAAAVSLASPRWPDGLFVNPLMTAMYGAAGMANPMASAATAPAVRADPARRTRGSRVAAAASGTSTPSGRTRYASPDSSPQASSHGHARARSMARTRQETADTAKKRNRPSLSPSAVSRANTGRSCNRSAAQKPAAGLNSRRPRR